ncbi:MAG: YceI family protein [Chloroflexi bacterium]|nr:MAG: YceI family protein [Chloroflexota bacterium]TMF94480.1 MAG: YceI family protein [Chloroflexota bacterium]TMG45977.1 MAG: YceI family protein [Chloroflexota bacterium]
MSRKLWIPIAAVAALVVLGSAGAYVYFFSGLRTSPASLALSSPSASSTASPTGSTTATGGTGTWQIGSGSLVGYRVKEQFAGQASTHEAVARTGDVTGQVTITSSGGTYQMTSAKVTVQLSNLASVDQVAGYNVTNRDRIVQRSLNVSSFPTAVFETQNVTLPAGAETGQAVTVSVPGKLTIHGVTKDVTATLQLRVSGSTAQIAGSIATNMTDYGISPPSVGFTTVQPAVTVEFQLDLSKG